MTGCSRMANQKSGPCGPAPSIGRHATDTPETGATSNNMCVVQKKGCNKVNTQIGWACMTCVHDRSIATATDPAESATLNWCWLFSIPTACLSVILIRCNQFSGRNHSRHFLETPSTISGAKECAGMCLLEDFPVSESKRMDIHLNPSLSSQTIARLRPELHIGALDRC